MKYFVTFAILLSVGCKNDDDSANVKTLDQLAGSKNVYSCQTDSRQNYPDAKLIERIVIDEKRCDATPGKLSADCQEVVKAVATVPKVFQDAFLELGGSIKVGSDTDRICGVTLKHGDAVEASKVSGIESCWAIAAGDSGQASAPSQVVVIAHRDMAAAKSYTTRVFGYFASQALPFINPKEGGGYSLEFHKDTNRHVNDALVSKKAAVADQFVREINASSDYKLSGLTNVLGEAYDYVKVNGVKPGLSGYTNHVKNRVLAFSDFVSADAFDSMFCGGDERLAAANKVFAGTIENYKKDVHPVLELLASNIAANSNAMNLTTSFDITQLLQILGIGAQALASAPKAQLQAANVQNVNLANGSTCGAGTCGGCTNCLNGNCASANGASFVGGGCGGNCSCPGCTCCAGPVSV